MGRGGGVTPSNWESIRHVGSDTQVASIATFWFFKAACAAHAEQNPEAT